MSKSADSPEFLARLGDEFARVGRAQAAEQHRRRRRRTRRLRTSVLAGVTVALLAGAAGATTGLIPLPHGGNPPFVASETRVPFDPALVERVSVLRRARIAGDDMGAAAEYVVGAAPGSSLRVRPPAPAPRTPHALPLSVSVWLVPAFDGGVSMQVLPPGATGPASAFAADVSMLSQGHAWMTLGHDVTGIVPDGVASVLVTLRSGARVELPVVDNVFGARFDAAVREVTFDGPRAPRGGG